MKGSVTMSFLTPDFNAAGPGVPDDEPQKHGVLRFFIVSGRKFWDMVLLNIMYLISSLPAILLYTVIGWVFLGDTGRGVGTLLAAEGLGAEELLMLQEGMHLILAFCFALLMVGCLGSGAPRAGMSYVLRNYSVESHAFLWSDFKEHSLKNFGKATAMLIIDLVIVFVLCFDIYAYSNQSGFLGLTATYFAIFLFIIYILMHPYIYMQMVSFDMNLKDIIKNAFYLTVIKLFQNIGCFIFALGLMILFIDVVYQWNMLIFVLVFLLYSFPCLVLDMNSFSVVKKYMVKD